MFDDTSRKVKERIKEKLGGGWVVGDRSAPLLDFSPDKAAVDKEALRRELRRKRDRGAEAAQYVLRREESLPSVGGLFGGGRSTPSLAGMVARQQASSAAPAADPPAASEPPASRGIKFFGRAAAPAPAPPPVTEAAAPAPKRFRSSSSAASSVGGSSATVPAPRRANSFASSAGAQPDKAGLLKELGGASGGGAAGGTAFVFRNESSQLTSDAPPFGAGAGNDRSGRAAGPRAAAAPGGGGGGGSLLGRILGKAKNWSKA